MYLKIFKDGFPEMDVLRRPRTKDNIKHRSRRPQRNRIYPKHNMTTVFYLYSIVYLHTILQYMFNSLSALVSPASCAHKLCTNFEHALLWQRWSAMRRSNAQLLIGHRPLAGTGLLKALLRCWVYCCLSTTELCPRFCSVPRWFRLTKRPEVL
jgi:hypothetical protein